MKVRQFRKLPVIVHEVLKAIGVVAGQLGYSAYLVGGIVRDIIIGTENLDLDIAIEGDAIRFARIFAARTGSVVRNPTRFGTCKIESKAFGTIDLASTRTEIYPHPGALPLVQPADIKADLGRRDFTINAMAICLNPHSYGLLVDPFGGHEDISKQLLRVLHEKSFTDDPTRILRGIRFAARYGFKFERGTARYLSDCLKGGCLKTISGERIFHEIELICRERQVASALAMLARKGILDALDGDARKENLAKYLRKVSIGIQRLRPCLDEREVEAWVIWFGALFAGLSSRRMQRVISHLRPPGRAKRLLLWLASDCKRLLRVLRQSHKDSYKTTRILNKVPMEGLVHLYSLSGTSERKAVLKYACYWRHVRPSLSGEDIVRLGVSQGPMVGKILERLTKLRLMGRIRSRKDEIETIRELLKGRRN